MCKCRDSVHSVGLGRCIVPDSSTGDHNEAVGLVKRRKERYHEASQPRMQVREKLKLWKYLDAENMFLLSEKSSDFGSISPNFLPNIGVVMNTALLVHEDLSY
jgi:hypothetical protein